jgi:peptidoglycan/LPS O-acetylase OafA/YrhL
MRVEEGRGLTALKVILAAEILSTAIHYTHNFVDVSHYPGPKDLYTVTRVAIVIAWPLLTGIGLMGYRRYREQRYREARVCLAVYSVTGIVTLGHFIYGNPKIPAPFYATLFTDFLTGLAVLCFALWSTNVDRAHTPRLGT